MLRTWFRRPRRALSSRVPYGRLAVELLESRAVPSVTSAFNASSGQLNITGAAANDKIAVSSDATGKILLNGSAISGVRLATVKKLVVNVGAGNDTVDLANLKGFKGSVLVNGQAGNDTITGSPGNDFLQGEAGDDVIGAGAGNDTVYGHYGNDAINGGDGNDRMHGDFGNDWLDGAAGNDTLYGGDGSDFLQGYTGNDWLEGQGGNDTIFAYYGNDTLFGGAGNDWLHGDFDHDQVYGQAGDDTLYGGDGNDWMNGNDGNDQAYGGAGIDRLFGEGGNDWLDAGSASEAVDGGTGLNWNAQTSTQLGPLETGTIVFGNGIPVGGFAQLTLYKNGSFHFVGKLRDSGLPSYDDTVSFAIKGASGTLYTFTHTGHMAGTFERGSRDDAWDVSGTNPALEAAWQDVTLGVLAGQWTWRARVDLSLGALLDSFKQAFGFVKDVVEIVRLVF